MYKFNDNADHSPLIDANVVADDQFRATVADGNLTPNTEYHFDTSYTFGVKGHQELNQSVMSNAAGGITADKPLSVIFGPVSPPTALKAGIVDVWFKLPGSLGTLGQPAPLSDGGVAEIYGKLKLAPQYHDLPPNKGMESLGSSLRY